MLKELNEILWSLLYIEMKSVFSQSQITQHLLNIFFLKKILLRGQTCQNCIFLIQQSLPEFPKVCDHSPQATRLSSRRLGLGLQPFHPIAEVLLKKSWVVVEDLTTDLSLEMLAQSWWKRTTCKNMDEFKSTSNKTPLFLLFDVVIMNCNYLVVRRLLAWLAVRQWQAQACLMTVDRRWCEGEEKDAGNSLQWIPIQTWKIVKRTTFK